MYNPLDLNSLYHYYLDDLLRIELNSTFQNYSNEQTTTTTNPTQTNPLFFAAIYPISPISMAYASNASTTRFRSTPPLSLVLFSHVCSEMCPNDT
jgi:hypothetical protein